MHAYLSFLNALGWSLLNSVWQMAACWIAYYLITVSNKRLTPVGKFNLVILTVFSCSVWFAYSFIALLINRAENPVAGFIPHTEVTIRWLPYLSMIYLVILTARFLQYLYSCYRHLLRKKHSHKFISPGLQLFTEKQAARLGISKEVIVYLSDQTDTAETSGWIKPLIFLPFHLVTRLSSEHLEAILVHELLHIRRNDYLVNIFMTLFRYIFFFNPFARLLYESMEKERELACDDGVIHMDYSPAIYAEALFHLEKFRHLKPGISLAADGNRPWLLMDRIQRLLGKSTHKKRRVRPYLLISLLFAFALFSIQQKEITEYPNNFLTVNKSVLPSERQAFIQVKKNNPVFEKRIKLSISIKPSKKRQNPILVSINDNRYELPDPASSYETKIYADQEEKRNFSNQPETETVFPNIQSFPGAPYVPAASLAYNTSIDTIELNGPAGKSFETRITKWISEQALAKLNLAKADMKKNQRQLKSMEIKNRQLILLDEKNIQPLLEKIRKEIRFKEQEIKQLQIQLGYSEEEIIHI